MRATILPDLRNGNGEWLKSYSPSPYNSIRTRAGRLWDNMLTRCNIHGSDNGFKDFQEFANWCLIGNDGNQQYGYDKLTEGRIWQLDKDIIGIKRKIYSPETCIFVPNEINQMFRTIKTTLPLGVSRLPSGKFRAEITLTNCRKHLGVYDTPEEAGIAFLAARALRIVTLITESSALSSHNRLIKTLREDYNYEL